MEYLKNRLIEEKYEMKKTVSGFITSIILLVTICALMLFTPVRGLAQSGENEFILNSVAKVNGDVLTEKELLFTLMRVYSEETIYDLIEDHIIISQAEIMGVSLEPNEVVEYLAGAYSPEKLSALLNAFGEDTLDQTVGTQLLALKTVTAKIDQIVTEHGLEVTDEQISDYYFATLPLWTTPASVRFSMVETATQAEADSARQRILAGEDFADVCGEVSTHPATREAGGDIGGLVPEGYSSGERALLESTAFDLDIGEVSVPLEVEDKWYLVTPTDKTEYEQPSLENMHDLIHANLLDQLVQPYLEDWLAGLVDQAEIEITYPIMVDTSSDSFTPGENESFIAPTIGSVNGLSIPEGSLLFHLLRQYGSDTIQSMIEEILYTQQGVDMAVTVDAQDIYNGLSDIYDESTIDILYAAFSSEAVNNTFSRHLTALDVMGTKWQEIIEQQDIEITEEIIHSYYLQHLHEWVRPEMVQFSVIICESEPDAAAARERIENGENFADVCRDVSIDDQTRSYGGDIGAPIRRGFFTGDNAVIEDTAFDTPVGSVSQPFVVGVTWFLIKTTDRTDAFEPSIAEMREEIYSALLEQKVMPFFTGWRSTVWEESEIEVTYPIYADNSSPEFNAG